MCPRMIFVPGQVLIREMFKGVLEYGGKEPDEVFLMRFGLFDTAVMFSEF